MFSDPLPQSILIVGSDSGHAKLNFLPAVSGHLLHIVGILSHYSFILFQHGFHSFRYPVRGFQTHALHNVHSIDSFIHLPLLDGLACKKVFNDP